MPGYKVTTVEPVKEGIVCPHCGLMLRDGIQTEEGLRLCKTCYEEICLEPDHTCPRCGISVTPKQFWPDRAVQRDILETLVRCDFHALGCPWQGQLKHLEEHSQGCRYQPVRCPNHTYGCSELLAPDEVDKHLDQECQYHCQLECLAAGLEEHLTTCPKYPVICDRCGQSVSRDQHEEHQLDSRAIVECQVCGKQLAQFGTETTSITTEPEHTQEHLTDPQEIFSHMQKLAFLSKGNHRMLKQNKGEVDNINTLQLELEQQAEKLQKRLSLLESAVESAQAGKMDKNYGIKLDDLRLKTRQQQDKILKLEDLVKSLQSQVEQQSRAMSSLEIAVESTRAGKMDRTDRDKLDDLQSQVEQQSRAMSSLEIAVESTRAGKMDRTDRDKLDDLQSQVEQQSRAIAQMQQQQLQASVVSTQDGCRKLESDDIGEAPSLKELASLPVADQWFELGVQLEVPMNKLREFEDKRVSRCLIAMFEWWLENGKTTTRSQLAEALRAINRRDLANKLWTPKEPVKIIYPVTGSDHEASSLSVSGAIRFPAP